MNELPDPRNIDWDSPAQCKVFWDACKTMSRAELLSYEDKYTIGSLQRFGDADRARLQNLFPEAEAWASSVTALTLEEMNDERVMEPFHAQMKKMRGLPRIIAWSIAMKIGIDARERTKRIHELFTPIILQTFQIPGF